MKYNKVTLFCLVSLLSSPTFADEYDDTSSARQDNAHFYQGVRLGWNKVKDFCGEATGSACADDTMGYGLYGGYQLNSWFALEGGVTDYGDTTFSANGETIETYSKSAELSAMFKYQFSDNWSIYTRLGTSFQKLNQGSNINGTSSEKSWNPLGAVGFDYAIADKWSLRAEYQYIDDVSTEREEDMNLHFTSLGLTYHFGQEKPVVIPCDCEPTEVMAEPEPKVIIQEKTITKVVTRKPLVLGGEALFAFNSTEVKPNEDLDKLAEALKKHDSGNVTITGYSDSRGEADYNLKLSEKRAQSVADYLVEQGVDSSRLTVVGKGEENPIADNMYEAGRKQNRRVELTFETQIEDVQQTEEIEERPADANSTQMQ